MNAREKICSFLFERSKIPYVRLFKKSKVPWNLTVNDLRVDFPPDSVGHKLADFLEKNRFEMIPKLERHDVYHVLTGYGTEVQDEIALQYLCLGNGKRSKYLLGVVLIGTILIPEYWRYYLKSFWRGRAAEKFYHLDFRKLLERDYKNLKHSIFGKPKMQSL